MTVVSVGEAKASFERLVAAAEAGQTVVIARNGEPVAQLSPFPTRATRTPGRMKGRVRISEDFDDWTEADEATWFGTGSGAAGS